VAASFFRMMMNLLKRIIGRKFLALIDYCDKVEWQYRAVNLRN
jgi:hypothetical protein